MDRMQMRTYFWRNHNQRWVESGLHHPNALKVKMKINVTQAASTLTVLIIRTVHTTHDDQIVWG